MSALRRKGEGDRGIGGKRAKCLICTIKTLDETWISVVGVDGYAFKYSNLKSAHLIGIFPLPLPPFPYP